MSVREAVLALMLSASVASPVLAEDEVPEPGQSPIIAAIKDGKLLLDVRYRFEYKSQDGFSEDAYANTIRTRLGFETAEIYNLKFLVEFENVASIGSDHFNSTTSGRAQFPVIADPDATELRRGTRRDGRLNNPCPPLSNPRSAPALSPGPPELM